MRTTNDIYEYWEREWNKENLSDIQRSDAQKVINILKKYVSDNEGPLPFFAYWSATPVKYARSALVKQFLGTTQFKRFHYTVEYILASFQSLLYWETEQVEVCDKTKSWGDDYSDNKKKKLNYRILSEQYKSSNEFNIIQYEIASSDAPTLTDYISNTQYAAAKEKLITNQLKHDNDEVVLFIAHQRGQVDSHFINETDELSQIWKLIEAKTGFHYGSIDFGTILKRYHQLGGISKTLANGWNVQEKSDSSSSKEKYYSCERIQHKIKAIQLKWSSGSTCQLSILLSTCESVPEIDVIHSPYLKVKAIKGEHTELSLKQSIEIDKKLLAGYLAKLLTFDTHIQAVVNDIVATLKLDLTIRPIDSTNEFNTAINEANQDNYDLINIIINKTIADLSENSENLTISVEQLFELIHIANSKKNTHFADLQHRFEPLYFYLLKHEHNQWLVELFSFIVESQNTNLLCKIHGFLLNSSLPTLVHNHELNNEPLVGNRRIEANLKQFKPHEDKAAVMPTQSTVLNL